MKAINSKFAYYELIDNIIKNNDRVTLSTFGIGIYQEDSRWYGILDRMNSKKKISNIWVGLPFFFPCTLECKGCEDKHRADLKNILDYVIKYDNINWALMSKHHIKFFAGIKLGSADQHLSSEMLIGGRNLSDSTWNDVSYYITDEKVIQDTIASIGAGSVDPGNVDGDAPVMRRGQYNGLLADSNSIEESYKDWAIKNNANEEEWKKIVDYWISQRELV